MATQRVTFPWVTGLRRVKHGIMVDAGANAVFDRLPHHNDPALRSCRCDNSGWVLFTATRSSSLLGVTVTVVKMSLDVMFHQTTC